MLSRRVYHERNYICSNTLQVYFNSKVKVIFWIEIDLCVLDELVYFILMVPCIVDLY